MNVIIIIDGLYLRLSFRFSSLVLNENPLESIQRTIFFFKSIFSFAFGKFNVLRAACWLIFFFWLVIDIFNFIW